MRCLYRNDVRKTVLFSLFFILHGLYKNIVFQEQYKKDLFHRTYVLVKYKVFTSSIPAKQDVICCGNSIRYHCKMKFNHTLISSKGKIAYVIKSWFAKWKISSIFEFKLLIILSCFTVTCDLKALLLECTRSRWVYTLSICPDLI